MPQRKVPLAKDEIYHVCSKSIAGFIIFNTNKGYQRMFDEIVFYSVDKPPCKFTHYNNSKKQDAFDERVNSGNCKKLVEIIAYCLMPTHLHLILKELRKNGISTFMKLILSSYSQYFNLTHKRRGPLWEGRFGNVLLDDNDIFAHVTRYIHINPVVAGLVEDPKDWKYSSYREYVGIVEKNKRICDFSQYLDMDAATYEKYAKDRIAYQKELAQIKHLTLE